MRRRPNPSTRPRRSGATLTALLVLATGFAAAPGVARAQVRVPTEAGDSQNVLRADTARAAIRVRVAATPDSSAASSAGAAADSAAVRTYARRFRIAEGLARRIVQAARLEGVEPAVAFGLVRVESNFQENAVGSGGALGLTQVLHGTARSMQPGITREQVMNGDTNLRLGFRYLRGMLKKYDGDVEEALFAYKYGPVNLARLRKAGRDPGSYARIVLEHGDTTRVVGPRPRAFRRKPPP